MSVFRCPQCGEVFAGPDDVESIVIEALHDHMDEHTENDAQ